MTRLLRDLLLGPECPRCGERTRHGHRVKAWAHGQPYYPCEGLARWRQARR